MKCFAILVFAVAWAGGGMPVVPLGTTPELPLYDPFVTQLIASAEREVLAALSDIRAYAGNGATADLLGALAAAAQRGIDVRVLGETRATGPGPDQRAAFAYLEGQGVAVRWDDPEVTLHAKFIVIDRRWVVVGSTHWTMSALTRSVQLDIAVEDEQLGDAFGRFFDLLWDGQLRAIPELSPPPWPRPVVVPLLDFPRGGLHAQLVPEMVRAAGRSLQVLLYRLTYYPAYAGSPSNLIVDELCRAAARGVEVRVLLEGGEDFADLAHGNRVSAAYLAACGVAVRWDSPGTTLHAKGLIVDDRDVLVSSANWSYYSLVQNVEAGLAFLGVPELALPLRHWFDSLWDGARPQP